MSVLRLSGISQVGAAVGEQCVVAAQGGEVDVDLGDAALRGGEARAQPCEVGQLAGVEDGVERLGELSLAGMLVGDGE